VNPRRERQGSCRAIDGKADSSRGATPNFFLLIEVVFPPECMLSQLT
jgi:hypothetical protein